LSKNRQQNLDIIIFEKFIFDIRCIHWHRLGYIGYTAYKITNLSSKFNANATDLSYKKRPLHVLIVLLIAAIIVPFLNFQLTNAGLVKESLKIHLKQVSVSSAFHVLTVRMFWLWAKIQNQSIGSTFVNFVIGIQRKLIWKKRELKFYKIIFLN